MAIYKEAFTQAGWAIVDERPEELVEAHYGKNGRNLWAYLHINVDGYNIRVGDEGNLDTQLTKDCHVALTGVTARPTGSTSMPMDQIAAVQIVSEDQGDVLLQLHL